MSRFVFSVAAVFSLLLPTLISPAAALSAYAKRCPDEPPSTLLSLYRKSDAIYLGKYDKKTEGNLVREEEGYKTFNVADHYSISTAFKGEPRKFFERTYEEYRFNDETAADPELEMEGDYDDYKPTKIGDTVLLFLKYDEDAAANEDGSQKLTVAHYRDGIKRIDAESLSSYEARINDLNGLFSNGKPSDQAIVMWLLRCIEDPVTRWEGAYVLFDGFYELEWRERMEKEAAETGDASDSETAEEAVSNEGTDPAVVENEGEYPEEEGFDNSVYAELLTDAQKEWLTDLALSTGAVKQDGESDTEGPEEMSKGDRILFELVKRWGDERLAAVMLHRLQISSDIYDKLNWMSSIAEILKDKELTKISGEFGDVTWQEVDEVVASSDEKSDEMSNEVLKEGPGKTAEKPAEAETKEKAEAKAPAETAPAPEQKEVTKTYRMLRDELVSSFIDRTILVLSQKQDQADGK